MKGIRLGFVVGLAVQVAVSLLLDRATYRPGRLRASWRQFRRTPLLTKEVWAQLKDYDRPDFHPDDRDTDALVTEWRARLFGDDGDLNGLLVRPGAGAAA
jgi:predicted metal-dependent hydrolase